MESLIQTYLPNVYKMGWAGQAGWGTAIYLTLYMTVLSFIIGGFLGLVAGLFLVLTAPGGVLENKVVFWILDKITSIFRAVPFIILLAILSPLSHLIVKTSIGPNAALVPLSFAVFAFFARQVQVVLAELDGGVIEGGSSERSDFLGHRGCLPIRRSSRFDPCDDCDLDFPCWGNSYGRCGWSWWYR
ncbi:ABC transporter permease [Streptococcus pneumoniae]|nr:ABC transporter permease [Streptococcus pneumoniae]